MESHKKWSPISSLEKNCSQVSSDTYTSIRNKLLLLGPFWQIQLKKDTRGIASLDWNENMK